MKKGSESKKKLRRYASILEQYNLLPTDKMLLKLVSDQLMIPEITLSRVLKKYGIKKQAPYKGFPAKAKPLRQLSLNKWLTNPHPRGMLGKKHSEKNVALMKEGAKKMWLDPLHRVNSHEYRQAMSDRSSAMMARRPAITVYSNSKGGKRDDLNGMYFRSRWEANYARYLNLLRDRGEIFDWKYEPTTFWFENIQRGTRSYKPDFAIYEIEGVISYYIEIKGWMDPKSITRMKRMKKYYPDIEVRIVGPKEYRGLKNVSCVIPGWESDKNC